MSNSMIKFATALALTFAIGACANKIQKAELPSTANPSTEISKLEKSMNAAYVDHVDVLAPDDFQKAEKYTDEAREDFAEKDDKEEILENIAYAQAYLTRAQGTADARRPQIAGVLQARKGALLSGARAYPEESDRLKELDDELRDASESFVDEFSPGDIARIQQQYILLETSAIKTKHLHNARTKIDAAIKADAKDRTPHSLRKAEVDVNSASNMISANSHNPDRYMPAVEQANESAEFLYDVITMARDTGRDTSETVAIQLVNQKRELARQQQALTRKDRQIGSLGTALGETQTSLENTNMTVAQKEAALRAQNAALAAQGATIALQEALERARTEFHPSEAEAYQQGDKLLIRLKGMRFASGKSELPSDSIALLTKVNTVIGDLNTSNIVVEGHTDSVGGADVNQRISQERADAVAKYLRENSDRQADIIAVGVGFNKPIASNKTREGRAQNRRVDVIVTAGPESGDTMEDRTPASLDE